ncbi:MAG TPA: ATP-binding protein [Candidatus Angelobacter sp.]
MAKYFSVDARAMLTWGRESIKDHTTAVLELVKNSYDAGATVVEVQIFTGLFAEGGPYIRIADDGIGMSSEDVANHWLRLGYSAKREEKFAAQGRRRTGEKGVGRISADRLGAVLELRSQAASQPSVGLRVNWNEFELPGRDLERIEVEELQDTQFLVPQPSAWDAKTEEYGSTPAPVPNSPKRAGTELLIRHLRQDWDAQDIQELRRLLSLLTSPFERVKDFQVRIDNNIDVACNGVAPSPLLASAAIEADFSLRMDGKVTGSMTYRSPESRRRIKTSVSVPFDQLVHPKPRSDTQTSTHKLLKRLGPVSTRLLFYPQRAETVRGLDLNLTDLRQFLQTNAGVRVYRDGIRVPPYGDQDRPEGDWLALGDRKTRNPAGPARSDFRVSPIQLVGGVFIGRDTNPELVDTSGREGLVAGETLALLKSFLIGCLTRLETQYHQLFVSQLKTSKEQVQSPRDTVDELRVQLSDLASTIKKAEEELPESVANQSKGVIEQLASTSEKLKRAEKAFEELSSQAAVSRTLATIGIASATFGHETQRGLDSMRATLEAASLLLRNGENPDDVLSELEKAISESEKVSAWGAFALGRVRRDRRVRRVIEIAGLINEVLNEILPAMEASSIAMVRDLEPIKAKVFAMDIECVTINLLTNAYYFCKQSSRDRKVIVRLKSRKNEERRGFDLIVADSGPGVAKSIRERIWDPLFTTKTDDTGKEIGTGLGLALVNAVVQDMEGTRAVDQDPKLGGARFSVWFPDAGA